MSTKAEASESFSTGWVCVDCLMLFANGETPPELDESQASAWIAEIERRTAGYEVALGMVASEHADDCPNVAADGTWEGITDCECEQDSFSWSPCDTCGSTLGGSRDAVTFVPDVTARDGMDMGFALVYSLARELSGDEYCLNQRWL